MPDDNTQDDLNKSGDGASGADQSGENNQGGGDESKPKMVEIPEEELSQIKSDRDNYRAAMLAKKAQDRSLDDKEEDQQGQKAETPDVEKLIDQKFNSFQETTRKNLQTRAQHDFLKQNQEFSDDAQWSQLASHIRLRGDEVTADDYRDRIEEAKLLHMRETGKLDEYLETERQKAKHQGEMEGQVRQGMQAGNTGDGRQGGGQGAQGLTPEGEALARRMGNDPEKIKKVDVTKDRIIREV